jgi:hypothetical protein
VHVLADGDTSDRNTELFQLLHDAFLADMVVTSANEKVV